jgi:hypothetical protein
VRQLVDEAIRALPWKEVPHLVVPDNIHHDGQGRHPDDVASKAPNAHSSAATLSGHLAFVRLALSQTLTRGVDASADKVCSEQLGLGSTRIGSLALQRFVPVPSLTPLLTSSPNAD